MTEHAAKRSAAPPSLKDAAWLKQAETERVFAALAGPGVETRAVGGAVRNTLLGLPVTEIDLATTALPEKVMALARGADLKAVPTGIEHGTVTVVADGVPFEVTTLRRDVETFGRHATVAFTEDWEEDARRRDFTLNALYAGSDGERVRSAGRLCRSCCRPRALHRRCRRRASKRTISASCASSASTLITARARSTQPDLPHACSCARASISFRRNGWQASCASCSSRLKRSGAVEALFDYGLLTQLLGGVPRLLRFARLVAAEEALGLVARRGAQARGARRLRRGGRRAACRAFAPLQCRAGGAFAWRRRPRGSRASRRGSGQAGALSARAVQLRGACAARLGGRRHSTGGSGLAAGAAACRPLGGAGVPLARARHHGAGRWRRARDRRDPASSSRPSGWPAVSPQSRETLLARAAELSRKSPKPDR